jgi:hypothetical protein
MDHQALIGSDVVFMTRTFRWGRPRSAVDGADAQLLVRDCCLVQWEPRDLVVQQAAGGEVEDLDELRSVAPVRRPDAGLVGDSEERERKAATTQPDDGDVGDHARTRRGDEVEDDVCPQALGGLAFPVP